MNLDTFSRPLDIKDIVFGSDNYGHDQVQIDYVDPGTKYPRNCRAWFKGERNIKIAHDLKVGDKFCVERVEYEKKNDEGKYVRVVLMSIYPYSGSGSSTV